MDREKNILVCPMDWGLGHATRMVPVIEAIEKHGSNAILAADNRPFDFLKKRFPNNQIIRLSGFSPRYSDNKSMAWTMIKSFPTMIKAAVNAKKELDKIITRYKIDAVISDNRYELSTPRVPTIFITHQLNIQVNGIQRIAKSLIDRLIFRFINNFDELWIPDIEGHMNLSGELSFSSKFNTKKHNIGLLSRFLSDIESIKCNNFDLLIILSGPEPQRTILEDLLLKQALKSKLDTVILLGKPETDRTRTIENVKLISHINDDEFLGLLKSASYVVTRPGYSTLMDLAVLNKKAILIPTPGQTEQEYLAKKLLSEKAFFSTSQSRFNLIDAIGEADNYNGLSIKNNSEKLNKRILNLLNNC
jgi:uncharacterized protein (TIGR00661 family)